MKTVYLPYMCDHVYAVEAAFKALGQNAQVLLPNDDESLEIGMDFTIGKECSPCFMTTGDIVRLTQQPGFDPAQSVIMMPTTAGPCRFGQYASLQRDILDQAGLEQVEIISPSAANAYQGLGKNSTKLRQLVWQGTVATDLLQKLLYEYRPYETNKGQTDELYQQGLAHIKEGVQAGGGKPLIKAMQWIAKQFEQLSVDRSEPRPIIGIIGEIYIRLNNYGNQDIIRKVEAIGGEVRIASMMEWLYYSNWAVKNNARHSHLFLSFISMSIVDFYQQHQEHKLLKPVEHLLSHPHETPVAKLMDNIRPFYEPALDTEAVLSMGKAVDFAQLGLNGILNLMPFSCMPGIITAGMAPRIRADLGNIPWLDVIFDAQGGTHFNTRLEAFMYQATQYQRRTETRSGVENRKSVIPEPVTLTT
jgi:predicted nucleotide-binding protein (sugar kinase/HSP70/actin superfamily)